MAESDGQDRNGRDGIGQEVEVGNRSGGLRPFFYLLGFTGLYLALQLWILPAAGIPT